MIDRARFFSTIRQAFGSLAQPQVDGLSFLLSRYEADEAMSDRRFIAYGLATEKHEGANKWVPIEEYGKGRGHSYGEPAGPFGHRYYGRGRVQLTWLRNYQTMQDRLGTIIVDGAAVPRVPLVEHPELALDPTHSYEILSVGMREGLFTGRKLADYIHADATDYLNCRRVINGLDRADTVAGYAVTFQSALGA